MTMKEKSNDAIGLPLSRSVLRVLRDAGIFAYSRVTVERQELAQRYVVRGIESGGALGDLGRYVTFANELGAPIEHLHPVESIAVNGVHAVVIAPSFVRVEMIRKGRTYDLMITRHAPGQPKDGSSPRLESEVLFRGYHGRLELDLSGKDKSQAGSVEPTFYSLAGEAIAIPAEFRSVIRSITRAVNCRKCAHSHYVRAPKERQEQHGMRPATTPVSVQAPTEVPA
jgi:hypothetical protein